MSLTTQSVNASSQNFDMFHAALVSQNYDAHEQESSLIDYSVEENRLYENFDGTIAIAEKPLGFVIGEQIVAPLIEKVSSAVTYAFHFGVESCKYINRMFSFPAVSADSSCSPPSECSSWTFKTHVESMWSNGPTYNHHVSNTGSHSDKMIYNPPDGWAIRNYRVHEHVNYGHSGYSISIVAAGSKFVTEKEITNKFNSEISASDGDKRYQLTTLRDAYLREYHKIQASHQTLVLDAHTRGKGIFQGGGKLHMDVEVELVRFHYEKSIREVNTICSVSNAHFNKDSCYTISFASGGEQSNWLLSAHRHYNQDKRDEGSSYAMIHSPGYGSDRWRIVTEDSGRTFRIFLSNSAGYQQVGWLLSAHRHYEKDIRNENSAYAMVHSPGYGSHDWKIIKTGEIYAILLANNAGYEQAGWLLSAHRSNDQDKRDEGSTYAIVHAPEYGGHDWKIEEVSC